ncbi:low-temperature-induced 65 kDa protein-like [Arachis stenosperma]|uniref:low-temperature-induced 65 kDa protein-like n=1 Tax=Arachis stenosperma TaxID=217475 RepID=UPI0025AD8689|nr:low-temperature-induced 65 kDa protein-like [Arachis stenosperma]
MESEVVRSHQEQDENDEQQPPFNDAASQLEEQHSDPEKKSSVMNKVKARAKKIKDTVKKHGQRVLDHVHDNSSSEDQNSPVHHDINEPENQQVDRELVDESGDVKDAPPTYQQVENYVKNAATESEQVENLGKSEANYGGTTNMGEEPQDKAGTVGVVSPTDENIATEEVKEGHSKDNLENISEAYTATQNYQTGTVGESEAVQSSPPTYEKVEDFVKSAKPEPEQVENLDKSVPSSGGTTPFVGEESHHQPRVVGASPTTETNEDITTEPAKAFAEEEKFEGNLENPTSLGKELHPPGSRPEAYTIPPSYQTEDTDSTGKDPDDEIKIKEVEKSFEEKIKDDPKSVLVPKFLPDSAETQNSSDGNKDQSVQKPDPQLSSATKTEHPPDHENHERDLPELVQEKETQFASDTISSSTSSHRENPEATEQTFNSNISRDEMENPSKEKSYSDEISSATSAIAADRAISAEDVTAVPKSDHGEKGDGDDKVTTLEEGKRDDSSNKSGKNIATSVTEKLAPVYGKVAGVGSAVKSKVSGTRSDDSVGVETENVDKGEDKRVNVKDYLAEKLKPGEEDKALSEVISEAFNKRKEDPKKACEGEDAIKKQGEEAKEKVKSETVAETEESNVSSPGKSVVGKIKGVVGSWFGGKSEENQSSSKGGEDLTLNKNSGEIQAEGERRLEE